MGVETMGDRTRDTCLGHGRAVETLGDRTRDTCLGDGRAVETPDIVVARHPTGAGSHHPRAHPCDELIIMFGGRALVELSVSAAAPLPIDEAT
jgi:hypothetical protein